MGEGLGEGGWGKGGGVGSSTNTERYKELRPPPPALPAHKQQVKGPNLDQKFDVLPLLATG